MAQTTRLASFGPAACHGVVVGDGGRCRCCGWLSWVWCDRSQVRCVKFHLQCDPCYTLWMVHTHSRYRSTQCAKIHHQHWGRHSGTFYAVIHRMRQHAEDSSRAKCCYTFKFPLPSLHNLPFLRTPQCIFAKSGILGR